MRFFVISLWNTKDKLHKEIKAVERTVKLYVLTKAIQRNVENR